MRNEMRQERTIWHESKHFGIRKTGTARRREKGTEIRSRSIWSIQNPMRRKFLGLGSWSVLRSVTSCLSKSPQLPIPHLPKSKDSMSESRSIIILRIAKSKDQDDPFYKRSNCTSY